jgi:hypothetical protein
MLKPYLKSIILFSIILLNFALQSFDIIQFNFKNFYTWQGDNSLLPAFFINKLLRLGLNFLGLKLVLNKHILSIKPYYTHLLLFLAFLTSLYLASFFLWVPSEISKFLNPILFSPLLVMVAWAQQFMPKNQAAK